MKAPGENQRPARFEEMLKFFQADRSKGDSGYKNAMQQLRNVVAGTDTEGIKEDYYPDWDLADIEDLLRELGELPN